MLVGSRFGRYVVVGSVAFAVDFGMLLVLARFGPLLVANSIAFIVANAVNFVFAHFWVFKRSAAQFTFATYVSTLGVSVVGLVLNDMLVLGMVELLSTGLGVAKVVATIVVLGWNYVARLIWIYKN